MLVIIDLLLLTISAMIVIRPLVVVIILLLIALVVLLLLLILCIIGCPTTSEIHVVIRGFSFEELLVEARLCLLLGLLWDGLRVLLIMVRSACSTIVLLRDVAEHLLSEAALGLGLGRGMREGLIGRDLERSCVFGFFVRVVFVHFKSLAA